MNDISIDFEANFLGQEEGDVYTQTEYKMSKNKDGSDR